MFFRLLQLEVVHETPLSLTVDGHNGIGPYLAKYTMDRVIEKAKKVGAGFGALRNSSHFGMAALWAEMATSEGFIGMSFTNTRICSVVTYGKERILGTNPICFAIPSAGKTPFVLDMATTTTAHGKVEVYERRNKPMPLGWVVDENGNDTTDTIEFQKLYRSTNPYGGHLFLGGAGEELGGHKGYGLGLIRGSAVRRHVDGRMVQRDLQQDRRLQSRQLLRSYPDRSFRKRRGYRGACRSDSARECAKALKHKARKESTSMEKRK